MGKHEVKVSNYHPHKSGGRGWDIYVQDERGRTQHKMHVESFSKEGDRIGKSFLESITGAIASIFNKNK